MPYRINVELKMLTVLLLAYALEQHIDILKLWLLLLVAKDLSVPLWPPL